MTQEALGLRADLAPVTLSKLETGINKPTLEIFLALAHALDVSPNYLAGWQGAERVAASAERQLLLNRLCLASEDLPTEWLEQLVGLAETASKS